METQNNYKRTVAGSVGAGMGAIFNGSGRTYYILEHKTSSKYHSAGESQKIIIDQIEIGRDASCQVRYDESFDTVSRKHAAIVRDGNNWQLIHLSQSNPTLVNGRPIQGTYYLQSGDEIQLSVNGPRLGFIQPQGKQGLTSSIKLTERMNLFRQQALRPYRRAIWALSALLLLAIVGFGAWNYKLSLDNKALRQEMAMYQVKLDSLATVKQNLMQEEQQLNEQLATAPEAKKEEIRQKIVYVKSRISTVASEASRYQQQLSQARRQAAEDGMDEDEINDIVNPAAPGESSATIASIGDPDINHNVYNPSVPVPGEAAAMEGARNANPTAHGDPSGTIRDYYNHIYSLKIRRISCEKDGRSIDPGISLSDVVCGTAFVMSNGALVTARQNIEPWIFAKQLGGRWREILLNYKAMDFNIIIEYDAYSTTGTARKFSFNNQDFVVNRGGDIVEVIHEVMKEVRVEIKKNGWKFSSKEFHDVQVSVLTPSSECWAVLPGKGGAGIPYDAGASLSSDGGTEVQVAGFKNNPDIHNLSDYISYFKSSTSRADTRNGTIVLQDANHNAGYLGSPAFFKEADGSYRAIGVMIGQLYGEDRLVPIATILKWC
ncbi:MAG: FHA domain-containing protein [Prevotella sp.]|nr:FHA domain-containing protein [Prevotella sp.]